jgi:hypothetical protein
MLDTPADEGRCWGKRQQLHHIDPDMCRSMRSGQCRALDVHDVKAGVEADTIGYNTLSKACVEARDVAKAKRWMSVMLKAGSRQTPSAIPH